MTGLIVNWASSNRGLRAQYLAIRDLLRRKRGKLDECLLCPRCKRIVPAHLFLDSHLWTNRCGNTCHRGQPSLIKARVAWKTKLSSPGASIQAKQTGRKESIVSGKQQPIEIPTPSGLANCLAQGGNSLSWAEAYRKPVLLSTADYRSLVGILSDPNNPFGVHKDFHAVHIFKHYKLHVASFWQSLLALGNGNITTPFGRLPENRRCTHNPTVNSAAPNFARPPSSQGIGRVYRKEYRSSISSVVFEGGLSWAFCLCAAGYVFGAVRTT